MNNFFNNPFSQNNRAKPYYPEALNINAQSQSFDTNQQNDQQQNFSQQNQNFQQNIFSNLFNGQSGNNMFSNLFNSNELLTSLLAGNLFGNNNNPDTKNNMIMQALSNMMTSSNKSQKQSEENVEKVVDVSSTYEEL